MSGEPSDFTIPTTPPLNADGIVASSIPSAPFIEPFKLQAVYNAVKMGMPVYEAMLLSELDDTQIAYLDDDADFTRHVRFYQQSKVYDLLVKADIAMNLNLRSGNTTELRWLLSKLDRKHFGNGPVEIGGSDDLPPVQFTRKD